MDTIQYEVTYKTEAGKPQYVQSFTTGKAAIAFMFHIETTGGISVMQEVHKKAEHNSTYGVIDNGE